MKSLVMLLVMTLLTSFSLQASDDFQKLKVAVDTRDLGKLYSLLNNANIDPNARLEDSKIALFPLDGVTILHYVLQDGEFLRDAPKVFMDFLDALLKNKRVDVNIISGFGYAPLHQAARFLAKYREGRNVVKRLLDQPEIKANRTTPFLQETALHTAVRHASEPGFVEEFLNKPKVNVNIENRLKETPVMVAALFSKSPDVMRAVVYHDRVNLEVENRLGYTVWNLMSGSAYIPSEDKGELMREILRESERKFKSMEGCYL